MNLGKKALRPDLFYKCLKSINVGKVAAARIHNRGEIGNRDWVGFARNGTAAYFDLSLYPFPAVRFKENSNELLALREKEKGDWRKLTIEEKKILYRASFRQTFSEFDAPTGEWKSVMGWTMFFTAMGLWLFIIVKCFALDPLPESFSEENRRMQLRRMLVERYGHLTGVSSKWDYELDDWKK